MKNKCSFENNDDGEILIVYFLIYQVILKWNNTNIKLVLNEKKYLEMNCFIYVY